MRGENLWEKNLGRCRKFDDPLWRILKSQADLCLGDHWRWHSLTLTTPSRDVRSEAAEPKKEEERSNPFGGWRAAMNTECGK